MNVLNFPISSSRSDEFLFSFETLDQCERCLDLILDEIVPLALRNRGLDEQASRVTALSGDLRSRLLELYSILDQVIQLLDVDRQDRSDFERTTHDKNMSAFNCLSDACYVVMMYNDARSYTSPEDVAYYLKFAEDFAQSCVRYAVEAVPQSKKIGALTMNLNRVSRAAIWPPQGA